MAPAKASASGAAASSKKRAADQMKQMNDAIAHNTDQLEDFVGGMNKLQKL